MQFSQNQINFAAWCATTGCGVLVQDHLAAPDPLMQSLYYFHVYYQMRRILDEMQKSKKGFWSEWSRTPPPPIVYTRGAHLLFSLGAAGAPFFGGAIGDVHFGATRYLGASFLYQGRGHTCCFFGAAGAPLFWWRNRGRRNKGPGSLVFVPGRTWTIFWRNMGPGSPVFTPGWRTSGAHPKSPIVYTRATLAHTPSRPSPILGRFWRTCCFFNLYADMDHDFVVQPSCTC